MKNHRIRSVQKLCLAALFSLAGASAFAGMVNVNIEPTAFSPSTVTIHANDQVQWVWVSNFHSTTSNNATMLLPMGSVPHMIP